MFSHWANPPQGEAFGAGRGQGRSEEDQPVERGLSGSPRQGLPMAAPGEAAPNRLSSVLLSPCCHFSRLPLSWGMGPV